MLRTVLAAIAVPAALGEWDLGMALKQHKVHKQLVDAAETDTSGDAGGGSSKPVHIVFSTGCNAYQHWQSEVLKSSAWNVGQRGPMTQIVVGCDVDAMKAAETSSMDARTSSGGDADRIVTKAQWEKSANPNVKVCHHSPCRHSERSRQHCASVTCAAAVSRALSPDGRSFDTPSFLSLATAMFVHTRAHTPFPPVSPLGSLRAGGAGVG
jgi:hypothetical protein